MLFESFWQAGFESACHVNAAGQRLDMIASVEHDRRAEDDYALIRELGITTARDGIRWHLVDSAGRYDFSSVLPMIQAAERQGVQVIWNLCHYGWPDDVEFWSAAFVDRFARYAAACARLLGEHGDGVPFFAPINEISFLSYAIDGGGWNGGVGHGRGGEVKRQLVRAAIAAMDAIWEVSPRARFVHVDPIIRVLPQRGRSSRAADRQEASQWEAWDMIAGRAAPELGGHMRYLDIIGANFYHANQWEMPNRRLRWEDEPRDDRWVPLHRLLERVFVRYARPLYLAETSHFGSGRARWIREIADEVAQARAIGLPIDGVCLYPILDRTDWDDPTHWHNSGLFDFAPGTLNRVINAEYAEALLDAQRLLDDTGSGVRAAS